MTVKTYCNVCGKEMKGRPRMYVGFKKFVPDMIPAIYPPPTYNFRYHLCDAHAPLVWKFIQSLESTAKGEE